MTPLCLFVVLVFCFIKQTSEETQQEFQNQNKKGTFIRDVQNLPCSKRSSYVQDDSEWNRNSASVPYSKEDDVLLGNSANERDSTSDVNVLYGKNVQSGYSNFERNLNNAASIQYRKNSNKQFRNSNNFDRTLIENAANIPCFKTVNDLDGNSANHPADFTCSCGAQCSCPKSCSCRQKKSVLTTSKQQQAPNLNNRLAIRDQAEALTAAEQAEALTAEDQAAALTAGDQTEALTDGDQAEALTAGDQTEALTAGDLAEALTSGDQAEALTAGDQSEALTADDSLDITAGEQTEALTAGEQTEALTAGDQAEALTAADQAEALTAGDQAEALPAGDQAEGLTAGDQTGALTAGDQSEALTAGDQAEALTAGDQAEALTASGTSDITAVELKEELPKQVASFSSEPDNSLSVKETYESLDALSVKKEISATENGEVLKENMVMPIDKESSGTVDNHIHSAVNTVVNDQRVNLLSSKKNDSTKSGREDSLNSLNVISFIRTEGGNLDSTNAIDPGNMNTANGLEVGNLDSTKTIDTVKADSTVNIDSDAIESESKLDDSQADKLNYIQTNVNFDQTRSLDSSSSDSKTFIPDADVQNIPNISNDQVDERVRNSVNVPYSNKDKELVMIHPDISYLKEDTRQAMSNEPQYFNLPVKDTEAQVCPGSPTENCCPPPQCTTPCCPTPCCRPTCPTMPPPCCPVDNLVKSVANKIQEESAAPLNFENEKSGIFTETRNEDISKSIDSQNADLEKASKYADFSGAKKLVVRTVEKVNEAEYPVSVGAKHPATLRKINPKEYEITRCKIDNDYNEEIRSKRDLLDTMETIQPLEDTREADCYGR